MLWFTSDESRCSRSKAALPALGCAWYSFPFPLGVHSQRKLLTKRLMLAARVTALGYNLLALDSDIILMLVRYGARAYNNNFNGKYGINIITVKTTTTTTI